ncbi:MAG: PEP-CTERM sorting domain-containing protein, partial [Phycisphaerae bacterium]|nr:PEP-CTERM sorting domain-containing protein [Phycisphaerae bacterium]
LTGVSSYVTLNSSVSNFATISIAPTGNGGFAVCGNSQPSVYFDTPSGSTFTESGANGGGNPDPRDLAGTIALTPQEAYQQYNNIGQRVGTSGLLANYSDFPGTTNPWIPMEGVRNPLLTNAWVVDSLDSTGTRIYDSSATGGVTTTGLVGHLFNSNGTPYTSGSNGIVSLQDGRIVTININAATPANSFFRTFTLTNSGLPAGNSVGAIGYVQDGETAYYGMRFSGDYQTPPPAPHAFSAVEGQFAGSTNQLNQAIKLDAFPGPGGLTVTNDGDPGSTLLITGYSVTGPQKDMFDLRDADGNVLLTTFVTPFAVSAGNSQMFELWFTGAGIPGVYGSWNDPTTTLLLYTNGTGTNGGTLEFFPQATVTPEPATMAFLALGGLTMIGAGLRRRRKA